MRLIDQLMDHPLHAERPVKLILEPLGFDVHTETHEPPVDPDEDREAFESYARDPEAYMESLPFGIPDGYTDMGRWENEDEIVMLAVKPTSAVAELLLAQEETAEPLAALARERRRQVEAEGWTPEHDDRYGQGELAAAASSYALKVRFMAQDADLSLPAMRPWDDAWWKPGTARRNLEKSGTLTLAEMERLARVEGSAE